MRDHLRLDLADNSLSGRLTPAARIADTLLHDTFSRGGFPQALTRRPHLVVIHGVRVADASVLHLAAQDLLGGTDDDAFALDATVRDWTDLESQRPNHVERLLVEVSVTTKPVIVLCRSRAEVPAIVAAVADAVLPLADRRSAVAGFLDDLDPRPFDEALLSRLAKLPMAYLNLVLRPGFSRERMWTVAGRLRRVGADREGNQAKTKGKGKRKDTATRPSVPDGGDACRLEDLPGMGAAQRWGLALAADLDQYRDGSLPWCDIEAGILLHGPPGTGKTMFARFLAGSCGVPLFVHSIAAWQARGHLGDLLKGMRAAFEEARKSVPCILFLDELDSVGSRDEPLGDNASYQRQVVNALLECLDGAARREGIVVVGATNKPDVIDGALLRPGRLGRHVEVRLPDLAGRIGILRLHLRGELEGVDLTGIAEEFGEVSGAALAQLVREARAAARRERRPLAEADLHAALPQGVLLSDTAFRRLCVHEAGHFVVGLELADVSGLLPRTVRVSRRVRNARDGRAEFDIVEGIDQTRENTRARILVTLAGLAAEEVLLGSRSKLSGGTADSDLVRATRLAADYEFSFGLGVGLHAVPAASTAREGTMPGGAMSRARVEGLLAECLNEAKLIVDRRRDDIEAFAARLANTSPVTFRSEPREGG